MDNDRFKISVLNGGFARLVSYTQPVPEEQVCTPSILDWQGHEMKVQPPGWTGDLEVVRNARVSYDADWRAGEDADKDAKLVKYLLKNRHTSPFEAMSFTFEIKAPLFVVAQWQRHRTWKYNQISARYAELDEEFYIPDVSQITTQSSSNKQMRTTQVHPQADVWREVLEKNNAAAFSLYREMLRAGVPRELARSVLPTAAYTRMFATVDLHNLFHFLTLRLHEHAQYEIRVYAEALLTLITPVVPHAVKAYQELRNGS